MQILVKKLVITFCFVFAGQGLFAATFTLGGGETLDIGAATLNVDGDMQTTGNITIAPSGQINTDTHFNKTSGNLTFTGGGGVIQATNGNVTNNGSFTAGGGTIAMTPSDGATYSFTGSSPYTFVVSGTSGTVRLASAISVVNFTKQSTSTFESNSLAVTVSNSFSVNGGNCNLAGSTVITPNSDISGTGYITRTSGQWTVGAGWSNTSTQNSFSWGTSTMLFDGTGTVSIINSTVATAALPNTTFANNGGTTYRIDTNDLNISGTLTINSGVTIDRETNDKNIIVAGGIANITNNGTIDTGPTSSAHQVMTESGSPAHVASLTPTFNWTFNDVNFGSGTVDTQGAYNVCVSTDGPITTIPADCEWQSGKTVSATTTSIAYAGPALSYYTTYNYKIQLWDQLNQQGVDSANLTFRPSAGTMSVSQTGGVVSGSAFAGLETVIQRQRFSASDLENLTLTQITMQAIAGGPDMNEAAELNSIRLYIDTNTDGVVNDGGAFYTQSGLGSFANDGTYNLNFSGSPQTVTAGNSVDVLVVYVLDQNNSVALNTFRAQLTDFIATGVTSGQALEDAIKLNADAGPAAFNGPNPLISGLKTVQVPALLVTKVTPTPRPSNILVNANSGTSGSITAVRLNFAETSAAVAAHVDIESITLNTSGTGDESTDLINIQIIRDNNSDGSVTIGPDVVLGTITPTSDNQQVVIDISGATATERRVPDGGSIEILVVYNFNGAADDGETFDVSFVSALGQQAASQVGSNAASAAVADTMTTRTGQFAASVGGANPANQTRLVNQGDLLVQHITLQETSSIENITLNQISFTSGGTGDSSPGVLIANNGVKLYFDANGDNIYNGGDTQIGGTGSNFAGGVGTNVTFTGLSQLITSSPSSFFLTYDFAGADAAVGQTFSVSVASFQGSTVSSGKTAFAGTGTPASNTVTTTKGALTLTHVGTYADATDNTAAPDTETSIMHFRVTETSGLESVDLTSLVITNTGTAEENNELNNTVDGGGQRAARIYQTNFTPGTSVLNAQARPGADNGNITFTFGAVTVTASGSQDFYVSYTSTIFAGTIGGRTLIANLDSSNLTTLTGTTGLAAIRTGTISGRTLQIKKPEVSFAEEALNTGAGQHFLVVEAATSMRTVFKVLITETTNTNDAFVSRLQFSTDLIGSEWNTGHAWDATGNTDLDDLALTSGGQELSVYHDANNNGGYDGGDTLVGTAMDITGNGSTVYNFTFGTPINIPRGSTQRYMLVAQVEAAPEFWDNATGTAAPALFRMNFDLDIAEAIGASAAVSDTSVTGSFPLAGTDLEFSRGLIDITNLDDTLYRVIANDENGVIVHFRFTNSTPAPVSVNFNQIDYNITSGDTALASFALYQDNGSDNFASQVALGTGTANNGANSLTLSSDFTLTDGASANFYLTAKVNPDASPGTKVNIQITSVSGAVSNGAGFSLTVPEITVDQGLDKEMEVRNNYPNFNNGEFSLIVFQNETGGSAKIKIYSISGEIVKDFGETTYSRTPAQVKWYGRTDRGDRVSFGVYFVQIETASYTKFKKVFVRKK